MMDYIAYLETYTEQIGQDQALFFRQHIDMLKMVTAKLNETLSIFAYTVVYNGDELKFPRSYFELHQDAKYGLVFDHDSDPDFVSIKLNEVEEVEDDGEIESVSTDGEGS